MSRYWALVWTAAFFVAFFGVAAFVLTTNYAYNWNAACAQLKGVRMQNMGGSNICVEGPVRVYPLAVRPW